MAMGTAGYYNFGDPRNKSNDRIINGVDGNGYAPAFVTPNAPSQAAPAWNPATFQPANDPLHPLLGQAPQAVGAPNQSGWLNGAGQPLPSQPPPAQGPPPPAGPTPGPMQGGYFDVINKAWDGYDQAAMKNVKSNWQSSASDRGLLPADTAGQALYGEMLSPVMQQLASGRAGALADAYGRDQTLQMQQQQMEFQKAQAAQESARWQQQFAATQSQQQQAQQWQQQQFDYQKQQDAAAQAWQKTQQEWTVQDRLRATQAQQQAQQQMPMTQQQALRQPLTGVAGPVNTGTSNGGESAAETFARLQGGDPTSFAPKTSTGMPMGGGAGLGGANPSGGLDSNTSAFKDWQERNQRPAWGGGTTTNPAPPPGSVPRPGTTPTGNFGIGAGVAGAATSGAPMGSPPGYVTPAWKSGFK